MIVNLSVYVPKTLTSEECAMLERLSQSTNFKGDSDTKRTIFQRFKNYFS